MKRITFNPKGTTLESSYRQQVNTIGKLKMSVITQCFIFAYWFISCVLPISLGFLITIGEIKVTMVHKHFDTLLFIGGGLITVVSFLLMIKALDDFSNRLNKFSEAKQNLDKEIHEFVKEKLTA